MTLVDPTNAVAERPALRDPAWSGMTHRIGWILQARQRNPSGLPAYDPEAKWTKARLGWEQSAESGELVLGVRRAKAAAKAIVDASDEYNALLNRTFRDAKLDVTFRREQPAVRYAPGIIVDFPAFILKQDGHDIASGRLCVTVCLHESRSKVWVRFSSMNEGRWGATPCDRLAAFTDTARAWYAAFAPSVVALYGAHIEHALRDSEEPDPEVILTQRGHVEFIAGDTDVQGLQYLTAAIAKRANVYEDPRSREAAEHLDAFVACVREMKMPDPAQRATGAVVRSDSSQFGAGRYYLIPHTTVRGSRGVFIALAQGNTLIVSGIAALDPDPLVRVERLDDADRPLRAMGTPPRPMGTPAQHVTAEIANTIAKYY
jgi:hypothetical protein